MRNTYFITTFAAAFRKAPEKINIFRVMAN